MMHVCKYSESAGYHSIIMHIIQHFWFLPRLPQIHDSAILCSDHLRSDPTPTGQSFDCP